MQEKQHYQCNHCGHRHLAESRGDVAVPQFCPETGVNVRDVFLQPYTERDWQRETDIVLMIDVAGSQLSSRELLLFACACLWECDEIAFDFEVRRLLTAGEDRADRLRLLSDLAASVTIPTVCDPTQPRSVVARTAALVVLSPDPVGAALVAAELLTDFQRQGIVHTAVTASELLRHITEGGIEIAQRLPDIPGTVIDAANQFYCGLIDRHQFVTDLAGADMLEAAPHFAEGHHPKGCWLLDRLRQVR